jgi:serine/threonine protein kinase
VFLCNPIGSDHKFAVKYINSSEKEEHEFGYKSHLNSAFVVKYYEFFAIDEGYCFVMEYFKNGSVGDLIKVYQKQNKRIESSVC